MSEETKEEVVPETNEEVVAETAEGTQAAVQSPYKGFFGKVDNFFGITKAKSNFKAEIVAGLTTFMAMVYILIVNPSLFSNIPGVSFQGMYIATSVGAIIGTLLMALLAKMPLAQASGMGVNAFVVFNLVLGGGLSYPNAMVFTLLDGVIFIILTATGLRKYIFTAIPDEVKKAITVGLGMFIAFIGLQNASVVIDNSSTLVQLVSLNVLVSNLVTYSAGTVGAMLPAFVALAGVIAIAVLSHYKVKGAILWGILGSTVLFYALAGIGCLIPGADLITYTAPVASESAPLFLDESLSSYLSTNWNAITGVYDYTLTNVPKEAFEAVFGNLAETELPVSHFFTNGEACKAIFTNIAFSNPLAAFSAWGVESAGKVFYEGFDFSGYLEVGGNTVGSLIVLLITSALSLCMLDMFDTLGTLYGACSKGGLLDEEGNPLNMNRCMLSDAIATCCGAIAGTSTVTTFVESSAGVAAGGKTGFTSLVTGLLFLLAMFLSPLAQLIPSAATATALIWVGVLMMSSVTDIEWTNPLAALPAFLTIAVMAFGYEISYGIGIGIISSVIVRVCAGKVKTVSIVTWIIAAFFLATFIFTH